MNKMIKQRNLNADETKAEGEFISVEWAGETAAEYLSLAQEYMKSCMLSDNAMERAKYYDSATDALAKLITPLQMVGALRDPDTLLEAWFGSTIASCCEFVDCEE